MSARVDRVAGRERWAATGLAVLAVALAIVAGLVATGRLPGSGPCDATGRTACTRVLFLGNSYTSVNDLPRVFADLASSGGQPVATGVVAPGGATLADLAAADETRTALGSRAWDRVVLQEQSQLPASRTAVATAMEPAAAILVDRIRAIGARPILLETWAHRDGWPDMGESDAAAMQAALLTGYLATGHALGVPIAPAGEAWAAARLVVPELALWQPDGSHPTLAGTYLAACVLYAALFDRSPEGLGFSAGLPGETARRLQAVAARTVLDQPGRWRAP